MVVLPHVSRLTRLIIFCVTVAVVGLIAELWLGSLAGTARYLVEREVSAATGLSAKIRGSLDLDLLPRLRIEATGVALTADGQSDPVLLIDDVELDLDPWLLLIGVVAIDELYVTGAQLNLRSIGDAPVLDIESLVADTDEDAGVGIDFQIQRVEMSGLRVEYGDSAGHASRVLVIDELTLAADSPETSISLSVDGSFEGSPFTVRGETGAATELFGSETPYPVSLTVRFPETGVDVEVTGHLVEPTRLRGIEAAVSIVVPDLSSFVPTALLSAENGMQFPLESIRITCKLRDPDGTLGVEDLLIETLDGSRVSFAATGSIRDLRRLSGVEIAAKIDADGLELLQPFVDVALPAFDAVEVRADISDRDGSLGVEGSVRASSADGALSIELSGSYGDLRNFDELDLVIDIRSRDLSLVGAALGLELTLPPIGPVTAHGRLRGNVSALGVEKFAVLVGERDATWLEIDGSIADLANLADLHFVAQFGVADLRHLQSLRERALPHVGPLRGGAILSDRKGALGIEHLHLTGGRPGVFEIDFSGGIRDLRNVDEITVDATFKVASLETVGALLDVEWPDIGPVSFEGHITGSDEDASMTGGMRIGESELVGTASAAFVSGTRPNIRARVKSRHIRFDPSGPSNGPETSNLAGVADLPWASWWSGKEALPFERLRAVDADIELLVDRISFDENIELHDLSVALKLDDGHLVFRASGAGHKGGSLRTELRVDAHKPVSVLTLGLEANDVNLGFWLTQLGSGIESTGILDASIALNSRGHSSAELRANMKGAFSAVVRDGTMASDYGKAFVKNVIQLSLPALLSYSTSPRPGFGCVVIEFEVDEGVAVAKTLALESKDIVVVGQGQIDFRSDAFDLVLSPKPRNPKVLSLSAEVDVTGPLAKPVFRARRRSIPGRVVRALLANVLAPVDTAFQPLRGEAVQLCREGLAPPTRFGELNRGLGE